MFANPVSYKAYNIDSRELKRLANRIVLVDRFSNLELIVDNEIEKFSRIFVDILLSEYRGSHESTRVEHVASFMLYPCERGIGVIDTARHVEWRVQYLESHQLLALASVLANVKVRIRLQGDGCHNLEVFINERQIIHIRPYIDELELLLGGEVPNVSIAWTEYVTVAELFRNNLVDLVEIREYFDKFSYVADPHRIRIRASGRYNGTIVIEYDDKTVIITQSRDKLSAHELANQKRETVQEHAREVRYIPATLDDLRTIYLELLKQAGELRRKKIRIEWKDGEGIIVEAPSFSRAMNAVRIIRQRLMKNNKICHSKVLEHDSNKVRILLVT